MIQNLFFFIFKGLSKKQIKTTFLEDESPTLNNYFREVILVALH